MTYQPLVDDESYKAFFAMALHASGKQNAVVIEVKKPGQESITLYLRERMHAMDLFPLGYLLRVSKSEWPYCVSSLLKTAFDHRQQEEAYIGRPKKAGWKKRVARIYIQAIIFHCMTNGYEIIQVKILHKN